MDIEKPNIFQRLKRLTFEDFKEMAKDNTLSIHEKIGFPNSYRQEYTKEILLDILLKIPVLFAENKTILDLGCGCDELATAIINYCGERHHKLLLVDSQEMLSLLPDYDFMEKVAGKFPDNEAFISSYQEAIDGIIVYSVLQHVVLEDNLFSFIDKALELLKPGAVLLLGDIPNISKRKRFFSSPKGIKTHQNFTATSEVPEVDFFHVEYEKIDDSILFAILQRYRSYGFETYLLPQSSSLPMATRREDILIIKPE